MKKNLEYYLSLNYAIKIEQMSDGQYCASVPLLRGCKGYGNTPNVALQELDGVKEALIELMLEQGKDIPEPIVELEIPVSEYSRLPNRKKLSQFVKSS
jgi:predicted RNase H-like HicB family nuclease